MKEYSECELCLQYFESIRYRDKICTSCIDSRVARVDHRYPLWELYKNVIYGLYKDNSLVYIGVTNNYRVRFHDHWFSKDFDEMRIIRSFKSREMADEFEKTAIIHYQPPLNILYSDINMSVSFKKSSWTRDLNRFKEV